MFSGRGSEKLGYMVSRLLKCEYGRAIYKKFPDNESYIRFLSSVEDKDVVLIYSLGLNPNEYLIETLLSVKTLRDLGCGKIRLVIPYFAYARQDERFNPGEAISIEIISEFIGNMDIDEIYTVDMHLHRYRDISDLFNIPAYNLTAMEEIAKYISQKYVLNNPLVIGPDSEAEQWAKIVAKKLGTEYDILEKRRIDEYNVVVVARKRDVKNRDIVIIDDIISTGGTVIESVNALRKMGANKIIVGCTHPLLVNNALRKIYSTGIFDLIGTDTVPSPVSYVSVAPVIAKALK